MRDAGFEGFLAVDSFLLRSWVVRVGPFRHAGTIAGSFRAVSVSVWRREKESNNESEKSEIEFLFACVPERKRREEKIHEREKNALLIFHIKWVIIRRNIKIPRLPSPWFIVILTKRSVPVYYIEECMNNT